MVVGFVVSVPLKQLSIHDTPSRTEISFQWDILPGDFYDRVCARMDLNPKDGILGYKFEGDAKKSIIQLPSNDLVAFDSMLEKVKSRIRRARTRAVILEIHDLVCLICSACTSYLLRYLQAAKRSSQSLVPKKKIIETPRPSLTIKQTRMLQILKRRLQCAEGHRPWCWVASDGTHRAVTIFQVTLWAQMVVRSFSCDPDFLITNPVIRLTELL